MPLSKSKPRAVPAAASFNTFKVSKQSSSRVRARFGPERRREVANVRRRRACLRCSLAKITCSADDICLNCTKLACDTSLHNRILPFAACIRTKLQEVSPFEPYLPINDSDSLDLILAKSDVLASTDITLAFANDVTWSTEALVKDVVEWLNHPLLSKTSKVGTMSSPEFLSTILESSSSVDESSGINFQLMLFATSLAHIQQTTPDNHEFGIPDLLQIGSVAGHEFLKHLDEKLKPQNLTKCTGDDIRALFLLAFGTILAVGYADDKGSNVTPGRQRQFKAMQEHICQILAHYVTYLGSQLKLPLASGTEQFMLEAAPAQWKKQGIFRWSTPCDHGNGIGEWPESSLFPGHDDITSQFVEPSRDIAGTNLPQDPENMFAGASHGFPYQNDPKAWGFPPQTHLTDSWADANPNPCFDFAPTEPSDLYPEALSNADSDPYLAYPNSGRPSDSTCPTECTRRHLDEPERTEYLLV